MLLRWSNSDAQQYGQLNVVETRAWPASHLGLKVRWQN
jgi:hypothetical protein